MGTRLSATHDDHPTPRHDTSTDTAARRFSRAAGKAARRADPRPDPPEVPADGADSADSGDDAAPVTVVVQPQDFRLPDVLRQIEAGRVVFVMVRRTTRD